MPRRSLVFTTFLLSALGGLWPTAARAQPAGIGPSTPLPDTGLPSDSSGRAGAVPGLSYDNPSLAPMPGADAYGSLALPKAGATPGSATTGAFPAGPTLPSLSRVLALSRENAAAVVLSRGDLAIGRSGYRAARLAPIANPYLEVFANRGPSRVTEDISIEANLWLPVEVSGQRGRRTAEVDALVAWKSVSVEAARAGAMGDAVRAYGEVLVEAERIRSFELVLGTSRAEAVMYEARLKAGDVTEQDAKLAQVELVRNSVSLLESRAALSRALANVARAVGGEEFAPPPPGPLAPPHFPVPFPLDRAVARSPYLAELRREADYHAQAKARQAVEAHVPVNVILSGGRGDLGETRWGGGLSWTFPLLRKNQGEQARSEAERARALAEREVRKRTLTTTLRGLAIERQMVHEAVAEMATVGEPAAQSAVVAATATLRAGKGDLPRVFLARRELALLRARRLELLRREWSLLGETVALTGELP